MASSDKKRKSKQKFSPSAGGARRTRALREIVRTKMKIKRWERYQSEISAGTRQPYTLNRGDKKGQVLESRWDTSGLKSHLSNLQGIVKQGKTV